MINREDIKEYFQYFVKQCETNNVPTDFPFFESFSHFSSSNTSRMITLIETCFNTEDSSLYYLLLLRSFSSVDELESFYHNVYKPILARSATSSFMIPTLQEYQTMRHGENDYITNLTKLQVDAEMDLIALVTLWEQCEDIHVERLCEVLSTLSQDVGICR